MDHELLERLAPDECLAVLHAAQVGRIAFLSSDGYPVILPINCLWVELPDGGRLVLRTHAGHAIDWAPEMVGFEVDGIDPVRHTGWSVLVQGELRHLPTPPLALLRTVDPQPWIGEGAGSWLEIRPRHITGRRLRQPDQPWPFHIVGYL